MARTLLIAANWKMNTTVEEARALVQAMLPELSQIQDVDTVLCPPFISLTTVAEQVKGSAVRVGAQNMHHEARGAFTGEISPLMLQGLCQYVVLGHSERRIHFGEKDFGINQKVLSALRNGLTPILCVGENAEEREHNEAIPVISHQLEMGFRAVVFHPSIVIAYEPVWSIGTGAPALPEDVEEVGQVIRKWLDMRFTGHPVDQVRILYGGSVAAHNVQGFVSLPTIDGALVGSASLRADEFVAIVKAAAAATKGKRG